MVHSYGIYTFPLKDAVCLGRNMSHMRFKYDIHFTDGLHVNLTRLNNAEFPDLTQGLINIVTDMYFARNCTDKFLMKLLMKWLKL